MAIEFGSRKETFENFKVYETTLAGRPFKVEMGKMCGLSNASALIRYGETCVLCNVVMSPKPREGVDFFPLNVEYEEKLYAAGRIPGSFMRREGRPGERAILTSRVVDRPMRPLFPKEMRNDVCITMTVMSLDPDCSPEIAGMIGASLVTAVSEHPVERPHRRRSGGPGGRRDRPEPHAGAAQGERPGPDRCRHHGQDRDDRGRCQRGGRGHHAQRHQGRPR